MTVISSSLPGVNGSTPAWDLPSNWGRFCRVFDEIRTFLRPQSHRNQPLPLEQRRRIHRERFAHVMGMMAAA
jgi:hypothetical protein